MVRRAKAELQPTAPLWIEGLGLVPILEQALVTNSVELVRFHVDRLREILDAREREMINHNTRVNMGSFLRQLPEYQEVEEFIQGVPDEQLKQHLQNVVDRGERYDNQPQ